MNLVFETEIDFTINDNKLTAQDGSKFTVEKSGNDIVVTDNSNCGVTNQRGGSKSVFSQVFGSMQVSGSNISINNGTVHINGFKIRANKGVVTIDGCATEILYNGKNLLSPADSPEEDTIKDELKENEYKAYILDSGSIDKIFVNNCGGIYIEDATVLSTESLSLSVKGSGDISFNTNSRENISSINVSVMGSGDIVLVNLRSSSFNASVMGSGDVSVKQSEFGNASLSVMGSGDITFKGSTASNVSKSVMGSGDIIGV